VKKGNYKWIIVNRFGNFWDGREFIKYPDNRKEYLTHGKAVLAFAKAKSSLKDKKERFYVELKKIAIEEQQEYKVETFAEWLAKTPL
jgi:hypothetical protein